MTSLSVVLESVGQRAVKLDRALLAIAVLGLGLALFRPQQAADSLVFTLENLAAISPFLLVSVGLAAWMKASSADHLITRVFEGRPVAVIISATLFGALSPFCSCGVIPIIAALLTAGVPLSAVMAFWISSPLMAPDMFLLITGELGVGFAVAKLVSTIAMGLAGGFATHWLMARGGFRDSLREGVGNGGCAASSVRNPKETVWPFWREPERRPVFFNELVKTSLFLGKWLALAFLLESLMVVWLPGDAVARVLGEGNPWSIPLAALIGVPAYLNGYAAIPLVAGLIKTGMAPGAGLAFITAGGVISIPAAIAVFALVKKPVFFWYLALSLVGSVLSGLVYQMVING